MKLYFNFDDSFNKSQHSIQTQTQTQTITEERREHKRREKRMDSQSDWDYSLEGSHHTIQKSNKLALIQHTTQQTQSNTQPNSTLI